MDSFELFRNPLIERKPTKIGKGCFIAGHSVIYPGVTIGDRVVVLPMSVVTKDIPSNCIIGGVPAKKIKDLDEEEISQKVKSMKQTEKDKARWEGWIE